MRLINRTVAEKRGFDILESPSSHHLYRKLLGIAEEIR